VVNQVFSKKFATKISLSMINSLQSWSFVLALCLRKSSTVMAASDNTTSIDTVPIPIPLYCTLCLQTANLPSPDGQATADGKTCSEIAEDAKLYTKNDDVCLSYYQMIGFTECGCGTIIPEDYKHPQMEERCDLCIDGEMSSIYSSFKHADFDSDANSKITCGQASSYLQTYHLTPETCETFQYNGVVNCGCSPMISHLEHVSCPLCGLDRQVIIEPNKSVFHQEHNNATCGIMEFILAVDTDAQYSSTTCSELQDFFRPDCCGDGDLGEEIESNSNAPSVLVIPSQIPSVMPVTEKSSSLTSSPSDKKTSQPSHNHVSPPSDNYSSAPSILSSSSKRPSIQPSLDKQTLSPLDKFTLSPSDQNTSPPSDQHSSQPSISFAPVVRPSNQPSISNKPSTSPTSIIDKEVNCDDLEEGIMPKVDGVAEMIVYSMYFDLIFEQEAGFDFDLTKTFEDWRERLHQSFDRTVSLIASGCRGESSNSVKEKIHYVNIGDIEIITDTSCIQNSLPENSSNLDIRCLSVSSNIKISFSSETKLKRRRLEEPDVKIYVQNIIKTNFPVISPNVIGVYNAIIVGNPKINMSDDSNFSSGNMIGLYVGFGCGFALIVAAVIMVNGRSKGYREGARNIIREAHIRSDDSISDNPTILSGRRGMMMGWEGSISDQHSEGSSRMSFSVHHDDASNGVEVRKMSPYQLNESSYLPASVIRDLLGTDNIDGISIGDDNEGLSIADDDLVDL